MKRTTISFLALSAVVALAGVMAFEEFKPTEKRLVAAVMVPVTPTNAIQQAEYAISGKVIDMQAQRVTLVPFDSDTVITTVTMQVNDDLLGNYDDKTIQFQIEGGEADKLRVIVEHSPEIELGENLVVFLNTSDGEQYPYQEGKYLVGEAQTAYEIKGNALKDKYSNNEYSRSLVLSQIQSIRG